MNQEIRSALVVCTRRIGDVLLATPLVRSIKVAYPDAAVDMLVFEGTQEVIAANSDIRRIWTIAERPAFWTHLRLLSSLWRRYDLSLSVLAGDRPTFYGWVTGRYRIGTLPTDRKSKWKRLLLNRCVPFDNFDTHTIAMNLKLLETIGVEPLPTPVVCWREDDAEAVRKAFPSVEGPGRFAVLHVSPKFAYKMWTVSGWAQLGQWVGQQGFSVVITGGKAPEEIAYAQAVVSELSVAAVNLAGRVGLPALGYLLSRAVLYVGTDTAVSHMAAAIGVPSVVLFGPSNPVKWGPWPCRFPLQSSSPWKRRGSQRQGNVFLLQGEGDCVPCLHEGCGRQITSLSDCLQHLPAQRVIQAARLMLDGSLVADNVGIPGANRAGSLVRENPVRDRSMEPRMGLL